MDELANCPKCGALFLKGVRTICKDCQAKVEEEYQQVATYLRDQANRKANIYDVSEATGVKVRQIRIFIRQGRLTLEGLPNMGYPCEMCGTIIREGEICESCRTNINRQVNEVMHGERQREHHQRVKDIGYRKYTDEEGQQR